MRRHRPRLVQLGSRPYQMFAEDRLGEKGKYTAAYTMACAPRDQADNYDGGITWAEAETRYPECSACWDRDGGSEHVGDQTDTMLILDIGSGLWIGWGSQEPFGWAMYFEDFSEDIDGLHRTSDPRWIFFTGDYKHPRPR